MTQTEPPQELTAGTGTTGDSATQAHEAYPEPDPRAGEYPDDWSERQQENWDKYAQPAYVRLETDIGRELFRRAWRPKARNDGLVTRDGAIIGTVEDWVDTYVAFMLGDTNRVSKKYQRKAAVSDADDEQLNKALADIVTALYRARDCDYNRTVDGLPHRGQELVMRFGYAPE